MIDAATGIVIDPTREEAMSAFAATTLKKQFCLPNETGQQALARAAKAFSGGDDALAQRLYDYSSQHWFMFATPLLANGGQRVATVVMYLNTPECGGATTFPDAHFEAAAIKGNAVFFSYDRAHPASRSLHGGAPVVAGEKWIATKWLRERPYR